jgi:hypothetical protein
MAGRSRLVSSAISLRLRYAPTQPSMPAQENQRRVASRRAAILTDRTRSSNGALAAVGLRYEKNCQLPPATRGSRSGRGLVIGPVIRIHGSRCAHPGRRSGGRGATPADRPGGRSTVACGGASRTPRCVAATLLDHARVPARRSASPRCEASATAIEPGDGRRRRAVEHSDASRTGDHH